MNVNLFETFKGENDIPYLKKTKGFRVACDNPSSPDEVRNFMNKAFQINKKTEEYVYLLCVNNKCKIIGCFEISRGTVESSLVGFREIFLKTILCGTNKFILVHNHVSGDVTPSKADLDVTKKLKKASQIMDMVLLDHIIIGDDNMFSFNENNII